MLNINLDSGILTIDLAQQPEEITAVRLKLPGGDLFYPLEQQPRPQPPPGQLLPIYRAHLETNEHKRANTIKSYRKRVGQFLEWIDQAPGHKLGCPSTWSTYFSSLKQRGLSPYTLRGHYHILAPFGRWCYDQGYSPTPTPLGDIRPPQVPSSSSPKAITIAHITKMIAVASSPRDRALLLFFRDSGCRAMEAIGLTWGAINLKAGQAQTVGKGGKARPLFFTTPTARALERYKIGQQGITPDCPVWPLTYDGLYKIFKRIARAAGLEQSIFSPHSWRHAFGRDTTQAGMPTAQLQDIMGHSSIKTTKIYIQFNQTELKAAHQRYSPLTQNIE